MERVQEELLCFSTILRTIAHSVRSQFGVLEKAYSSNNNNNKNENDEHNESDNKTGSFLSPSSNTENQQHRQQQQQNNPEKQQQALSLDETIELVDLAGQLLESDNNSYRIRSLLLETRPNLVEVLVGILVANPMSVLPPQLTALLHNNSNNANGSGPAATTTSRSNSTSGAMLFGGAAALRHEHENVQRRFASLQWKAMSNLARACALAAPTEATASQFGFVLDSFEVLNIALRYLVMDEAGLSLRTCAAEVLFLCATKLQLAERAAQSNETVDAIVFQLAESDHNVGGSNVVGARSGSLGIGRGNGNGGNATEDTLRCYLVGTLHAIGPVERLLSADFIDVAIGVLRDGPIYACTKILELLAQLFKRNPYFLPSSLPTDRVLLLCETFGAVLGRLGEHGEVVMAVCRVVEICAIVSALAVEDEAIVQSDEQREIQRDPFGAVAAANNSASLMAGGRQKSSSTHNHHHHNKQSPEDGPGRFILFFCHEGQNGPWRKLLIAGKTDPSLVEARAHQMRTMRILIQCIIDQQTMQRLSDDLSRDLPLFSALLSAPLRLPPFHDDSGHHYVCEASLCLTFLMAKVPSFRANVRRAVATFPAWLQNLENRLVEGMEAGLQNASHEISAIQLVDVCGNLLNSIGFVDRFTPRAWADVNALEVCVARLFEFQLRVDPHEPRPPLNNSNAADDDGAPFVAVFVDTDRKSMVLTTGVLAYAICLSFQEIINDKKYYDRSEDVARSYAGDGGDDKRTFGTDPALVAAGGLKSLFPTGNQKQQPSLRSGSNLVMTAESNFVATDAFEVGTEYSTDDGIITDHQNNLLAYSANAAVVNKNGSKVSVNNNNTNKPSPYSLHAMRAKNGAEQPSNNMFALPSSKPSAFQPPPFGNNNTKNFGSPASTTATPGFVQRNAVGRFEPVAVMRNENLSSNVNNNNLMMNNNNNNLRQPSTSSVVLPTFASASHHHNNNQPNNNTGRTSTSRSNSRSTSLNNRKSTPVRNGPIVNNNDNRKMWK